MLLSRTALLIVTLGCLTMVTATSPPCADLLVLATTFSCAILVLDSSCGWIHKHGAKKDQTFTSQSFVPSMCSRCASVSGASIVPEHYQFGHRLVATAEFGMVLSRRPSPRFPRSRAPHNCQTRRLGIISHLAAVSICTAQCTTALCCHMQADWP